MNASPSPIRHRFTHRFGFNYTFLLSMGVFSVLLLLLGGCASQDSKSKPKSTSQTNKPEIVASPLPTSPPPTKLKLLVSSPAALQVKQGDFIVKGQILVDRSAARQKVMVRRQKIQQEVVQLTTTEQVAAAPPSTVADVQIQQAQEQVRSAEAAIQEFLANSPYTDEARQRLSLPAEEEQLTQLQQAKSAAQSQLEQATAQRNSLQSTQQSRDQLKTSSAGRRKQLLNELKTIELQLKALEDIQSPHDAIVQNVDWQNQDNNGTTVELALTVHSVADPTSALPNPSSQDSALPLPPGSAPGLPPGTPPSGNQPLLNSPTPPANSQSPAAPTTPQTSVPVQVLTASRNL